MKVLYLSWNKYLKTKKYRYERIARCFLSFLLTQEKNINPIPRSHSNYKFKEFHRGEFI